jgi:hypothetical protein
VCPFVSALPRWPSHLAGHPDTMAGRSDPTPASTRSPAGRTRNRSIGIGLNEVTADAWIAAWEVAVSRRATATSSGGHGSAMSGDRYPVREIGDDGVNSVAFTIAEASSSVSLASAPPVTASLLVCTREDMNPAGGAHGLGLH